MMHKHHATNDPSSCSLMSSHVCFSPINVSHFLCHPSQKLVMQKTKNQDARWLLCSTPSTSNIVVQQCSHAPNLLAWSDLASQSQSLAPNARFRYESHVCPYQFVHTLRAKGNWIYMCISPFCQQQQSSGNKKSQPNNFLVEPLVAPLVLMQGYLVNSNDHPWVTHKNPCAIPGR